MHDELGQTGNAGPLARGGGAATHATESVDDTASALAQTYDQLDSLDHMTELGGDLYGVV